MGEEWVVVVVMFGFVFSLSLLFISQFKEILHRFETMNGFDFGVWISSGIQCGLKRQGRSWTAGAPSAVLIRQILRLGLFSLNPAFATWRALHRLFQPSLSCR